MAITGERRSGKTALLRAIAGLYQPASGRIVSGGDTWFDSEAGVMVACPQAHLSQQAEEVGSADIGTDGAQRRETGSAAAWARDISSSPRGHPVLQPA